MPTVQFAQFSSLVQPTFWHDLTRLKLEVLRLSDEQVPLNASYTLGKTVKDRNTGQEVALGCNISVGGESFNEGLRYGALIWCDREGLIIERDGFTVYLHGQWLRRVK